MSAADERLVIAVVAYGAAPLTIDCLASIEPERVSVPGLRVVVVDNCSPDGAADVVARAIDERGWGAWAELVRAPANRGFAAGNNIAIRIMQQCHADAKWLLLLNPDTVVRPGALRVLLDFMIARPEVGAAGGRSEDPDATPQACCFRFPGVVDEVVGHLAIGALSRLLDRYRTNLGIPSRPVRCDWVSGAFILFRREVVEQLGPMDEGYFLYFEETEYLLRAQRQGWQCWHVPDARIVHLVGQSSGVTVRDRRPRRMPGYWFESRRRYMVQHHGRFYAVLADLTLLLVCPIGRVRHYLMGKVPTSPPHYVGDLLRHSALWHGASTSQSVGRAGA